MVDLKELEKLSPEERIKRLQELQKKNKEEIEKAQKLIIESEEQLEKQKEIEEMIREVPLPKPKVGILDISKEETLEEQIKKEEPKLTEEQRQYGRVLAETRRIEEITQNVYNLEKDIEKDMQERGYINPEHLQQLEVRAYAAGIQKEEYKKKGLDYEAKKASRIEDDVNRFLYKMAA